MLKVVNAESQDESFLYQLFVSTRRDEFAMLGLPDQQMQALLRMQHEAQKNSYQQQFPRAKHQIIYDGDVCIGRIVTDINSQRIHLVDISLLPNYRGKGYGTELLRRLQSMATEKGLSITLHVLQGNSAKRLYERCGFYVTEELPPYIAMRWDYV